MSGHHGLERGREGVIKMSSTEEFFVVIGILCSECDAGYKNLYTRQSVIELYTKNFLKSICKIGKIHVKICRQFIASCQYQFFGLGSIPSLCTTLPLGTAG